MAPDARSVPACASTSRQRFCTAGTCCCLLRRRGAGRAVGHSRCAAPDRHGGWSSRTSLALRDAAVSHGHRRQARGEGARRQLGTRQRPRRSSSRSQRMLEIAARRRAAALPAAAPAVLRDARRSPPASAARRDRYALTPPIRSARRRSIACSFSFSSCSCRRPGSIGFCAARARRSSSCELTDVRSRAAETAQGRERRARRRVAAGQPRRRGAAARQLPEEHEGRRVRGHRARSHRDEDPGAHRDGREPPGSRLR